MKDQFLKLGSYTTHIFISSYPHIDVHDQGSRGQYCARSHKESLQKKDMFLLGLCPKLWVGGGQES